MNNKIMILNINTNKKIGGNKILAETKHLHRQNIGTDRNVRVNKNYSHRQKFSINKILSSTKSLRRQKSHVNKNLTLTKFSR